MSELSLLTPQLIRSLDEMNTQRGGSTTFEVEQLGYRAFRIKVPYGTHVLIGAGQESEAPAGVATHAAPQRGMTASPYFISLLAYLNESWESAACFKVAELDPGIFRIEEPDGSTVIVNVNAGTSYGFDPVIVGDSEFNAHWTQVVG